MFTPDRKEAEEFAKEHGLIVVWTNYTQDSDRICYATIKADDIDKWVESGWEPVEFE